MNHHDMAADTLKEQIVWLTEGLESLGHTVGYSHDNGDGDAINILWESFHPIVARQLVESGKRYAIVATEIPDGGGWNGHRNRGWKTRWKGFKLAASKAEFIWTLIPESIHQYEKMGIKASYLEYGFSERLVMKGKKKRDIDFFFYGGCGGHRQDRINALAGAGFTALHPGQILTADVRDAMMRRSKVILGLKYGEEWAYTSASRIGRAILGNCAVAHEWTEKVLRPAHLVPMMPKGGDWVEFAASVASKWKLHAESAMERYRLEMPIKRTMEAALEGVM